MNGGHTTHYFKLECGAHQGDPISAYFLVLVLETDATVILYSDWKVICLVQ